LCNYLLRVFHYCFILKIHKTIWRLLFIIVGKPIDICQFREGDNPIIFLIEYSAKKQYLDRGKNDEQLDKSPVSILSKDKVLEMMTLLLEYTSDLNFETVQGQIPLFVAFYENQVDILRLFFQYFIPKSIITTSINPITTSVTSFLIPEIPNRDLDDSTSLLSFTPKTSISSQFPKIPLNLNIFNEVWENVLLYTFKRLNDLPDPAFSFLLNFGLSNICREGRHSYYLDLNAQDWNSKTLVMLAVERCNYDFLKKFFETLWSVQCRSILHILYRCQHHFYYRNAMQHHSTLPSTFPTSSSEEDIIMQDLERVIKNDYRQFVDLEIRDITQNTALHQAIWTGHPGIVKCLLFHGAQANVIDSYGHTPLMIASLLGRITLVKLLIAYGADSNFRCGGMTALELAQENNHEEIVAFLLEYQND